MNSKISENQDKLVFDAINLRMLEVDNEFMNNPDFNGFYNCFFLLSAYLDTDLTSEEESERTNLLKQYNNITINKTYSEIKLENKNIGLIELQRLIQLELNNKKANIFPKLMRLMQKDRVLIDQFLKVNEPIKKREPDVIIVPPKGAIFVRKWKSN